MESKIIEWKTTILSHQTVIFTYVNVVWSLLEFSVFISSYPWLGLGFLLRFFMSWVLIWAHRKKHATTCKVWCLFEAIMVVIILTLGLCRTIKFSRLGLALSILSFFVKLCGLCIIYYFALEVVSDKEGCKHGKVFAISKPRSSVGEHDDSGYENRQSLNDYGDTYPLNNIETEDTKKTKITLSGSDSEVQYAVIYM